MQPRDTLLSNRTMLHVATLMALGGASEGPSHRAMMGFDEEAPPLLLTSRGESAQFCRSSRDDGEKSSECACAHQ